MPPESAEGTFRRAGRPVPGAEPTNDFDAAFAGPPPRLILWAWDRVLLVVQGRLPIVGDRAEQAAVSNRCRCFPPILSLGIFRVDRLGRFGEVVTASYYPGK